MRPPIRGLTAARTSAAPRDLTGERGARPRAGPPPAADPAASALIVAVPAVTAFAVAWFGIRRPSLWRDEAYTIVAASRSPAQILALLHNSDVVHGAYYMAMHVVIGLLGRSEAAVRAPSALATAAAAAAVALLGKRLAPYWPHLTGLLAGLLYAISPAVTRYAQEARSYATVAALAAFASYALVRALAQAGSAMSGPAEQRPAESGPAAHRPAGGRRWWVAYAVAVAATGLVNLFALLIVPAHAVTVFAATRARGRGFRSWAVSAGCAVAVLIPVIVGGYLQRGQTGWLGRPHWREVAFVPQFFAGSRLLLVPVGGLIAVGACAGLAEAARGRVTAASLAVPWLALPPAILLAVSQIRPVYDVRYIVFCLPAVALLAADGLARLAWLAARVLPSAGPVAAWLPSAAVIAIVGVASVAPQRALREPWSRPDDLRKVSSIVSMNARPGDAVLFVTQFSRIVSQGYPAPFRELADIALAKSPVASATLNGTEVSPAVLRSRFSAVHRVWVISDNGSRLPQVEDPIDAEKLALVRGLRQIASWRTRNDLLILYARP